MVMLLSLWLLSGVVSGALAFWVSWQRWPTVRRPHQGVWLRLALAEIPRGPYPVAHRLWFFVVKPALRPTWLRLRRYGLMGRR
jgi:hypothetical protein